MTLQDLQLWLQHSGRYQGHIDGSWGPHTAAAVLEAMTDGPDTRLTPEDFEASARRLGTEARKIRAVTVVESSGAGFAEGRPVLLFEPHRFSRATGGRFDASHPFVSYQHWDATKYPRSQQGRYNQLLEAVSLDVDAGFASASYGRFQILGENFRACGYPDALHFAAAQAYDEQTQLLAFENFIKARGLLVPLRFGNWAAFAEGYNGTAYKKNHYDEKLAAAAAV